MKKYILLTFLTFCLSIFSAMSSISKIYISVAQPDRAEIPSEAKKHLETKLKQLLTINGIADEDESNRFVLTSKVLISTKDIIAGPPQKISMNIDFIFMIGDVVENKVFETATISVIGVGNNENKAFISAIKNIKPKNSEIVSFIERAKEKVVSYYSTRCEQIKTKAQQCAASRNYGEAIYQLMLIPDICDCAADCQTLAIKYYNESLNMRAAQYLNEAKAKWAANPNAEGASLAADILAKIPANTQSQKGIEILTKEINGKLKADERRAWEFKMQQYQDRIEKEKREHELRAKQQEADNIYRAEQQRADNNYRAEQQAANNAYRSKQQAADNAARTQLIEACRQVGVEYAKNQPKSVTYNKNIILW